MSIEVLEWMLMTGLTGMSCFSFVFSSFFRLLRLSLGYTAELCTAWMVVMSISDHLLCNSIVESFDNCQVFYSLTNKSMVVYGFDGRERRGIT